MAARAEGERRDIHNYFTFAAQKVHATLAIVVAPARPPRAAAAASPGGPMASATDTSPKWKDMSFATKMVFIGKLMVFIASFGFAFPTLLND